MCNACKGESTLKVTNESSVMTLARSSSINATVFIDA